MPTRKFNSAKAVQHGLPITEDNLATTHVKSTNVYKKNLISNRSLILSLTSRAITASCRCTNSDNKFQLFASSRIIWLSTSKSQPAQRKNSHYRNKLKSYAPPCNTLNIESPRSQIVPMVVPEKQAKPTSDIQQTISAGTVLVSKGKRPGNLT